MAIIYSLMLDDMTSMLVTRFEAREEIDRLLYDWAGSSEAELRRNWGLDNRAQQQQATATDMFKAQGR